MAPLVSWINRCCGKQYHLHPINMQRFLASMAILMSVFSAGCSAKEDPQQWKNRFHAHSPRLERLIHRFQNDAQLDSCFHIRPDSGLPDIATSYPSVLKLLQAVGITDASSHKAARNKWTRWYYFKTNWPSDYPIYLIYDPTETIETEKGYYKKDKYANETWGVGGNWRMFRWVAVITDVCQGGE